jgi:dolichol-phosphate mannosyltransferase
MPRILKIAVVIPCYKVRKHILQVIKSIGVEVTKIYIIDDACPEKTGVFVSRHCKDKRVTILRNISNLGVGGAVMYGYQQAIHEKMDIIVKIDGDGQMDPRLIPIFIQPIICGVADYTKGNRFFDIDELTSMPKIRLFGNALLSFFTKFSSGYWNLFDPTNGYTAIHTSVASHLPFHKISNRYFFETDMLFRLNLLRAVVIDIPMAAKYSGEVSNMRISNILFEFIIKHIRNLFKRILYNYYLRDLSVASIELPIGIILLFFGVFYGLFNWSLSAHLGLRSSAGTVMLSALPIMSGIQLILAFLAYDINSVPVYPRSKILPLNTRR